ncbi:MAG: TIGR02281 family clan AA aspartic protease [Pseudomonadota bacterium]
MIRFDTSSGLVLALAVSSSLSAAWWLNHLDGRGRAEAAPVALSAAHGSDAQVLRGADGHYWAQADIDGRAVRVMIDTGASVVILTAEDAARLGVRLKDSDFGSTVQTASGLVGAAPVTLDHVAVAGARVDHVQALVVKDGLPHSLLGMSYLGRLSRFEATPAGLTLRP